MIQGKIHFRTFKNKVLPSEQTLVNTPDACYLERIVDKEYVYDVEGHAFPSNMSLLLKSTNYEALEFLDVDGRYLTVDNRGRSMVIKPTNVGVESRLDGTPKNKPLPVNTKLPALLGAYFNYAINLPERSAHNINQTITDTINYTLKTSKEVQVFKKVSLIQEVNGIEEKLDTSVPLKYTDYVDIEVRVRRKAHDYAIEYMRVEAPEISFVFEDVQTSYNKTYPFIQTSTTVRFDVKKLEERYEPEKVEVPKVQSNQVDLDFNFTTKERGTFLSTFDEVVKRHPNKDFSWIPKQDYRMVTDDTVEDIVSYLLTFPHLAVDIETTGLRLTFKSIGGKKVPYGDQIVGYIFSGKVGQSFFFPLRMNTVPNLAGGDHNVAFDKYIRPLLRIPSIYHNAQFDAKGAFIYGQPTNLLMDTLVAFKDTYGYERNMNVGLKDLSLSVLGRHSLEITDLTRTGQYGDANFADVPAELVVAYACPDADNTLMLYEYLVKNNILEKYNATRVVDIDSQFALAIAYQEFWGMHIDVDKMPELRETLNAELTKHLGTMKRLINDYNDQRIARGEAEVPEAKVFNPNSVQQVMRVAYEYLQVPVKTKLDKKKGLEKPTLDKGARKKLLKELTEGTVAYEFIHAYQEYSNSYTMVKTFTKNLNTIMTEDGFTFTDVNQFLETGRLSTSKPAYQNYSDAVKVFITGRKGYGISDNDFQSIEYKVIAGLSGEDRLLKAFQDPNTDYHKLQASNMHDVAYELVTPAMRQGAKAFNFGIPFGMGPEALGELLTGSRTEESTAYARKMMVKYFKGQEKVENFFKVTRANAVRDGYSSTYFGRRRYYNKARQSVGTIRRAAGNQPIQGTAADSFKIAATNTYNIIVERGWLGKVLMPGFIHDEMLFEVHESIHPLEWLKVIKEAAELRLQGFPPFYLGWGYGYNWKQAKSIEVVTELQNHLVTVDPWVEYPNWDGDALAFNKWLQQRIDRFEVEKIQNYLEDKSNDGVIMDAVIWGYLATHINSELRKATLQEQVADFAQTYNLSYTITPKDPNEVAKEAAEAGGSTKEQGYEGALDDDYVNDYNDQDSDYQKAKAHQVFIERLEVYGSYTDLDTKTITYIKDEQFLKTILSKTTQTPAYGDYHIQIYDLTEQKLYTTNFYISHSNSRLVNMAWMAQNPHLVAMREGV